MKITAKFRLKNGVPFSIEKLSGVVFRCGVCGKIFFSRDEMNKHLPGEKQVTYDKLHFPELDKNVMISAIYTKDVRDLTNPKYPRLVKGDKLFKQNKLE